MRQIALRMALSLVLFQSGTAHAAPADQAFTSLPSRFQTLELSTSARGLGEICYSRDQMPDGTVCNPAYLGEVKESFLIGKLFIGNGYQALSTANSLVNGTPNREFLEELFAKKNVISVEAHGALTFTTKYFSAGFSPYRLQFFSEVHNPNFPVAAVHAALERRFFLSGGIPLSLVEPKLKDFSAGMTTRFIQRKFVHSSFSFAQLLIQSPTELLPVTEQNLVFFEPAVGWHSKSLPLKPRASIAVQNLGFRSQKEPLYPEPADFALGAGIEPQAGPGRWKLGLDAVNLMHGEDLLSRLRLGSSYRYGIIEPMIGIHSRAFTMGAQFGVEMIQAGIVYEFLRDELTGGGIENRISTEVSFKL